MTDRKSRRVVIINNIDSANIDQAIFILKSDKAAPQKSVNASVAKEAQAIIDNYIRQVERIKDGYSTVLSAPARKKKLPHLLFLMLGALGLVCVGLTLTVFRMI